MLLGFGANLQVGLRRVDGDEKSRDGDAMNTEVQCDAVQGGFRSAKIFRHFAVLYKRFRCAAV